MSDQAQSFEQQQQQQQQVQQPAFFQPSSMDGTTSFAEQGGATQTIEGMDTDAKVEGESKVSSYSVVCIHYSLIQLY